SPTSLPRVPRRCRRSTPPARISGRYELGGGVRPPSEPPPEAGGAGGAGARSVKIPLLVGQILNGLATGMLYALMGIGLSIITGVLNIPNFAHGALFALGAYLLYTLIQLIDNFWLALLLAPLGVGLLGVVIEYGGLRPLSKNGHGYHPVLTFGVSPIRTER